jgi:hypothetical protein
MKHNLTWVLATLLATLVLNATHAADDARQPAKEPAARSLPFHGKLAAVDAKANTITVGKRVFLLTHETKITRDGASAKLTDAVVGDKVGGAYVKEEDGAMRVTSIRFGEKPDPSSKPGPKDPS